MFNFLSKILIVIIIILIIVSGFLCWSNTDYKNNVLSLQNQIEQLKVDLYRWTQQNSATQDYLNQKIDTIKKLTMIVDNLQHDVRFKTEQLKDKDKQYAFIYTQYSIMYDSVEVLNQEINNLGTFVRDIFNIKSDTTLQHQIFENDSTIEIPFAGRQKKISYAGKTVYFKFTGKAQYSLKILADLINIKSLIYLNPEGLIKNEIQTDGFLIGKVETKIDSALFDLLKKKPCPEQITETFFDKLQLGINPVLNYNSTDKFVFDPAIELWYSFGNGWGFTVGRNTKSWYSTINYYISLSKIFNSLK